MSIKFGTSADNALHGTSADDILYGLGGADLLYGEAGNDQLIGGSGNDTLYGGDGVDTAVFSTAHDVDARLWAENGSAWDLGFDLLYGIENLITGSGDDLVEGDEGANLLSAGAGLDVVHGEGGDDALYGGNGNDTLEGGEGDDFVQGGNGHDYVGGDGGDDVLEGNGGDDDLDGYVGVDVMTGGAGADDFFFRPGDSGTRLGNRDRITDFDQAEGDQIELNFFDGLSFVGNDAFTAADQVRYFHKSGSTFVQINTDADLAAESVIELTGTIDLVAGDFVL